MRSTHLRAAAAAALAGATMLLPTPVAAVEGNAVGQRYHDKLDSRLSASALVSATQALGYAGVARTAGRSSTQAWEDALRSSVIGYFGHAEAGVFQVDDLADNNADQFVAAGLDTDLVSTSANFRWWAEYLPFVDVDDLRLAILAGCYTAKSHPGFGQFSDMGTQRGIDAMVSFAGLVYYPATAAGTAMNETNYSGNYFWSRFSAHAKSGDTVSTALAQARTDMVGKEGDAGGWNGYRISGSVDVPGNTRIRPAAAGQGLTSQPMGVAPFTLADLTVTSSAPDNSALGPVEQVFTAEGVTYRRFANGTLLDVSAPASTEGDAMLGLDEARAAAIDFALPHVGDLTAGWMLTEETFTQHAPGERLAAFTWRPRTTDGTPGGIQVMVEVDRRTGAMTYFAVVADRTISPTGSDLITDDEAVATVSQLVDTTDAVVRVERDVWNVPRVTVTVDRGTDGLVPDVDRLVLDARTGDVLLATTA